MTLPVEDLLGNATAELKTAFHLLAKQSDDLASHGNVEGVFQTEALRKRVQAAFWVLCPSGEEGAVSDHRPGRKVPC